MPLYTQDPEPEEIDGSRLPATFGSVIGATASTAFDELPLLSSIPKAVELDLARTRYAWTQPKYDYAGAQAYVEAQGLPSDWLENKGYNKLELDILSRRKRDELARQDILMRDEGGLLSGSARLATALGVGMLDPLNVASAFIPVFSQERYAALLARQSGMLGRAGVRVGVGAVEGTVGAAVIEPLTYAVHEQEMADYTLTDSMLNIGFGAIFGASLHAGGGAVADIAARARVRQIDRILADTPLLPDAAKPAEAPVDTRQIVDITELRYIGKQVDEAVAARERALLAVTDDPAIRGVAERLDLSKTDARVQQLQQQLDVVSRHLAVPRAQQIAAEFERLKADPQFMTAERRRLNAKHIDEYVEARAARTVDARRAEWHQQAEALRTEAAPLSADVATFNRLRAAETDLEQIRYARDSARTLDDKLAALTPEQREAFGRRIERTLASIIPASEKVGKLPQTTRDALMRAAIAQTLSDQPIRVEGIAKLDTDRAAAPGAIRADAAHAADFRNSPIADMQAVREAQEQLASVKSDPLAQATAEMDEAESLLRDSLATLGDIEDLPADIRAEIAAADQFRGEVETMNRAASMLVQCAMRHPA